MPRFYFHLVDGHETEIKNKGLELADREVAWSEATTACGELLRDLDGSLKPGEKWRMIVKDETEAEIYELEFRTKVFT